MISVPPSNGGHIKALLAFFVGVKSRLIDTRMCLMEKCVCTHDNVSYLLMVVSQSFCERTNFAF